MEPASVDGLVRRFISVTLDLCSRVQAGLPEGTGLDPVQVLVCGNLYRLIEQEGELNGVGYFKHGIGATLWDARRPQEVLGVVDVDLARDPEGVTSYELRPGSVTVFADSLALEKPTQPEIRDACASLVAQRVLSPCTTPFAREPGSIIAGKWCFPRLALSHGEQRAWVADLGLELYWGPQQRAGEKPARHPASYWAAYRDQLKEARAYLELALLPYPKPARRQQSFDWSEVEIVEHIGPWRH